MKRARFLAYLMAAAMMTTALSGCGNTPASDTSTPPETTAPAATSDAPADATPTDAADAPAQTGDLPAGFPIVPEKITLRMMGSKAAIQGAWEDLSFFQEMERISNIHFEFDTPPSDVYPEKKNLMFASGDYPDLFFGGNLTDADEVVYGESQKILIPLNDLIEQYGTNIKAYAAENPQMLPGFTHSNGEIYTLGNVTPRTAYHVLTSIGWLNQDWVKQVGKEIPTNVDELYDVLKAFQGVDLNGNGEIDEIPISGKGIIHGELMGAFGLLGVEVQVVDDKVRFNPMTDAYKEYLAYANKLYTEGLLDNETFTQTSQQLSAKGANMQLGMFAHAAPFVIVPTEKSTDYIGLTPLTSALNPTPMTNEYYSTTRGAFAITSANKYPVETMKWVDYLYSQDGARMASIGVEGKDWEWEDKSILKTKSLAPEGMNGEEYRGGHCTPDCGTPLPRAEAKSAPPEEPHTIALMADAARISEFGVIPFPQIYYSVEDSEEISTLKVDITSYVEQMEARFITGEEPLTSWDTYIDNLKKLNIDKYIEIYQRNYDANK